MSSGHKEGTTCMVQDVLERIGNKWTVLIIATLERESKRFRVLQRAIPGISQRMLTLNLKRLERDGLVNRKVTPTVPPQVTYTLTQRGKSLAGVLRQLAHWAEENRTGIAVSRQNWDALLAANEEASENIMSV